jgi:hypothetical protein
VSHSIEDVVDADAIRKRCSALGVLGAVGPFPSVADIGIVANGNDDAAFIVANGAAGRGPMSTRLRYVTD